MDENNLILPSWMQEVKLFTENLLISRKRPTKDSVHDLRVAIKRMRSYLRLKQKITGENWKEQFTKTSALFKSFGKLRDFDMSLTLLRQWERKERLVFISFKQYLSANRTLSRRLAKKEAVNFDVQELNSFYPQFTLVTGRLTNHDICEAIIRLSQKKIKKVKELAKRFKKNVHEIRKQLKNVFYWLKICPPDPGNCFINLKELDKMLTFLGNWQDHFILIEKIKQFINELSVADDEEKKLEALEKKLASQQAVLLEKAMKKWEKVINE